jgi:drug/metabolite transporter (DMT)-like permease
MIATARHDRGSGRAYLLLTATALCWAANAIFGRLAVGEVSPMALVTLRWLGALGLLAVFAHARVRRDWPAIRPRLPFVAAMGALGFTAFNALYYVAAHWTTAVNLARLTSLTFNFGDLLMIAACALYSGYMLALRRRPPVSALGLFTVMAAAAFLASLPLALTEAALGRFQWPTATGWIILALVTLFPSFLAQIFFIQGIALIGPSRAGIFVNLVPVFASILAVLVLGEPFTRSHALALGLVLGGIWLAERGKPA